MHPSRGTGRFPTLKVSLLCTIKPWRMSELLNVMRVGRNDFSCDRRAVLMTTLYLVWNVTQKITQLSNHYGTEIFTPCFKAKLKFWSLHNHWSSTKIADTPAFRVLIKQQQISRRPWDPHCEALLQTLLVERFAFACWSRFKRIIPLAACCSLCSDVDVMPRVETRSTSSTCNFEAGLNTSCSMYT